MTGQAGLGCDYVSDNIKGRELEKNRFILKNIGSSKIKIGFHLLLTYLSK